MFQHVPSQRGIKLLSEILTIFFYSIGRPPKGRPASSLVYRYDPHPVRQKRNFSMPDDLALQAGLLPYYYLLASCFAPRDGAGGGPHGKARPFTRPLVRRRRALRQGGLNLLCIPASGSSNV